MNQNPDRNPLYDREFTNDFIEAMDEWLEQPKIKYELDTHLVYIEHPTGRVRVAEMGSEEHNMLICTKRVYMTGTEPLCHQVAAEFICHTREELYH